MITKTHDNLEYEYHFLDLIQYEDRFICRWEVRLAGVVKWLHEYSAEGLLPILISEVDTLL